MTGKNSRYPVADGGQDSQQTYKNDWNGWFCFHLMVAGTATDGSCGTAYDLALEACHYDMHTLLSYARPVPHCTRAKESGGWWLLLTNYGQRESDPLPSWSEGPRSSVITATVWEKSIIPNRHSTTFTRAHNLSPRWPYRKPWSTLKLSFQCWRGIGGTTSLRGVRDVEIS